MNGTPNWVELSPEDVEKLVVDLAKKGYPPSRIGIILRDQHGIPDVKQITGKSMMDILRAHNIKPEVPEDLMNIIRKAVNLHEHLERNPKDLVSKRALSILESRIHRLVKYYRRRRVLPPDWRYTRERAALLVRG